MRDRKSGVQKMIFKVCFFLIFKFLFFNEEVQLVHQNHALTIAWSEEKILNSLSLPFLLCASGEGVGQEQGRG